jgi:diguanylate cyclase (GGDEF)-like protein
MAGMMLDYRTLLISLGVSALCLLLTLFGTWMAGRRDGFLLTWVIGLAFLVPGIFGYTLYTEYPHWMIGVLCTSLMLLGFATIYAASVQFRQGEPPLRRGIQAALAANLITMPPMVLGYDGLSFIGLNIGSATLLFATAWHYWQARREAVGPLSGMATLYGATGISFILCASVLIHGGQWVLGHAPDNWAENLNIAISIAGMTGVGAMSLMVHQARITDHHRRESLTDALTGLFNRRALFEAHQKQSFSDEMAVIVFDIDRFKSINDQYGHAVGDRVIRLLAEELKDAMGVNTAARLGGEEFAAVVRTAAPGYAEWVAERIRRNFADREIDVDGVRLRATVSAGIAYGLAEGRSFDGILNAADGALYIAKRNGRNRVEKAVETVGEKRGGSRSTA